MNITAEIVCLIHDEIIKLTGGTEGVRDFGLLESCVNGIYQTFDNVELYPTIEDKAAMLCYNLISTHAFVDGNKRIGVNIMQTYLMICNRFIDFSDDELVELGLGVAQGKINKDGIKEWIKTHERNG